jgi:hypothetical protein
MADPTKLQDEERKTSSPVEIASIDQAPAAVLEEGSLDPVYEAKAKVLNKAIQDIGMGRYQWQVSCYLEISSMSKLGYSVVSAY